jgi:hypothetical protein
LHDFAGVRPRIVQSQNFIALFVYYSLGISVGLGAIAILILFFKDLFLERSEFDMVDIDVLFTVFFLSVSFVHSAETVLERRE